MAKKLQVIDSVFTVTDTVTGLIIYSLPSPDIWFQVASLQNDRVVILDRKNTSTLLTNNVAWQAELSDCVNSSDVSFTANSFIEFMHTSVGYATYAFSGSTGFASYTDTLYTSESPFELIADTPTILTNNAGIIYNDQLPSGISSFWDSISNLILGKNGNGMGIMLYWKVIPSSINSELDIWLDIGGDVGELYRETYYFRGTTVKSVLYGLPVAYNRSTWETNGATVYAQSTHDMGIYGANFNFNSNHKAK